MPQSNEHELVDSEQQSNADITDTSGIETPDREPEKHIVRVVSRKSGEDVEKQVQDQIPPQETAAPGEEVPKDPSLVEFDGPDDPDNPKNWTARRRAAITVSMGLMTFVVTFSSSIFAVAIEPVSKEYNVGTVTATLGVAFFLLVGFVEPSYM